MGGICGIVEQDAWVDEALLRRMRDAMVHRGPDDAGLCLSMDRKAGLAHRSLHISDRTSVGHQPACNEDETIWTTCDGEIYNLPELKRSLESKGHTFHSGCDAEVIVHLYEEMSEDFVSQLDGRFAIGLWDSNKNTLCLARDRLGEKPLYYMWDGTKFLFASELKAILEDRTVSRQIDPGALHDYLTLQYVPYPNTIFEGIKKLPPSHVLKFNKGQTQVQAYWSLSPEYDDLYRDDNYVEEKFTYLLHDSVRKRLPSSIPIGIHLTGGLSSGAIAAMMSGSLDGNLKSFSFGLEGKAIPDFEYGKMIANTFGFDHQNIVLESAQAAEIIPRIAGQLDEPLANQDSAAAYLISRIIAKEVRVCLSDEGGDEILGGCERHEIAFRCKGLADSLAFGNADIEADLRDSLTPSLDNYLNSQCSFDEGEMSRVLHPDIMSKLRNKKREFHQVKKQYDSYKNMNYLSRLQSLDISTYLTDNLNVKMDRMSMLASLQIRNPFIDHRLAQFSISLPQNHRVRTGIDKYILRRVMTNHLPARIVWQSNGKRSLPFHKLFNGDMEDYAKGLLLGPECDYFKKGYLHGLLNKGWQESPKMALKVWTLIMFEQWRRIYNV